MPVQYVGNGVYINVPGPTTTAAPYSSSLYRRNYYYAPRPAATYKPPNLWQQTWGSFPQRVQGAANWVGNKLNPPKPATPAPYQHPWTTIMPQLLGEKLTNTFLPPQNQNAVPYIADTPENQAKLERLPTQQETWQERAALYERNNPLPTGYAQPPTPTPVTPTYSGGGYGGYGGYGGGGGSYKTPYYQAQPKQSYYRGSPVPMTPDVANWLYQMVTWSI